jgi:hypothetical protein
MSIFELIFFFNENSGWNRDSKMKSNYAVCLLIAASLLIACSKKQDSDINKIHQQQKESGSTEYITEHETKINGLPAIGKWMFDSTGMPSAWLGKMLNGKAIIEPINIIIIDSASGSVDEAKQNLMSAFDKAGYNDRWGHSSGYKGLIAGRYYHQMPEKYFHAFSSHPLEFDNNHGRIFGPHFAGGVYYFTGALSRESGYFHNYISFTQARDDLAAALDSKTSYKLLKKENLNNSVTSDSLTTGDHDGNAILINVAN